MAQTRLYGTLCDNGHKNYGAPAHKAIQCTAISVSEQGRWEADANGSRHAVFRYAVRAANSQYETGGCCLPDDGGTIGFDKMSAYRLPRGDSD